MVRKIAKLTLCVSRPYQDIKIGILFSKMKVILGVSVHLVNIDTFGVKVCVCMLFEGKEEGKVELHSLAPWRTRVTIADIAYTPSGDMLAIVSDGNLCRYVAEPFNH